MQKCTTSMQHQNTLACWSQFTNRRFQWTTCSSYIHLNKPQKQKHYRLGRKAAVFQQSIYPSQIYYANKQQTKPIKRILHYVQMHTMLIPKCCKCVSLQISMSNKAESTVTQIWSDMHYVAVRKIQQATNSAAWCRKISMLHNYKNFVFDLDLSLAELQIVKHYGELIKYYMNVWNQHSQAFWRTVPRHIQVCRPTYVQMPVTSSPTLILHHWHGHKSETKNILIKTTDSETFNCRKKRKHSPSQVKFESSSSLSQSCRFDDL